jgi:hypothetical protein
MLNFSTVLNTCPFLVECRTLIVFFLLSPVGGFLPVDVSQIAISCNRNLRNGARWAVLHTIPLLPAAVNHIHLHP